MDPTTQGMNPLAMLQQISQQYPQLAQQYGTALSDYTTASKQSNDELTKLLQQQQQGNMSSPLFQLGAALLQPTRTGSFGEALGNGAAAFDKANTQGRNDMIDRAIKINALKNASAKFGLDAVSGQMDLLKNQVGMASTVGGLQKDIRSQNLQDQQLKNWYEAIDGSNMSPQEKKMLRAMGPEKGAEYLSKKGDLNPTEQNAILDKDEQTVASKESVQAVDSLLQPKLDAKGQPIPGSSINERSNSGLTAGIRAGAGRMLPNFVTESSIGKSIGLDEDSRVATTMLDTTLRSQMLPLMKLLGANPSNKDAELIEKLQGLSDKSPQERKAIMEAARKRAVEKQAELRAESEALRTKKYFKPGGSSIGDKPTPDTPAPAASIPQAAIDFLKANPTLTAEFDEQFGPGSAKRILGTR